MKLLSKNDGSIAELEDVFFLVLEAFDGLG